MKLFLTALACLFSAGAMAVSGLVYMRVNALEDSLPEQVVEALPKAPAPVSSPPPAERPAESSTLSAGLDEPDEADTRNAEPSENREISPGEFSSPAYDNGMLFELVSVKRLPPEEDGSRERVNVNLRIKRVEEDVESRGINFYRSMGRNPETNEVYKTRVGYATQVSTRELPVDTWGDAYFGLEVAEDVDTIDLILPEARILEDVPISE
ncbi:MAG: hypothetical protein AAFQ61_00650 [Cyanobacteria bacterium J06626_23]